MGSSTKSSGGTAPSNRSFAVNEINLTGYTDEHNMLQAMITLKKRQGVEIGLDQTTGLKLALVIGNSTLSTDSGHDYKWCPAVSTELGSRPAESRKSRKQHPGGKQAVRKSGLEPTSMLTAR